MSTNKPGLMENRETYAESEFAETQQLQTPITLPQTISDSPCLNFKQLMSIETSLGTVEIIQESAINQNWDLNIPNLIENAVPDLWKHYAGVRTDVLFRFQLQSHFQQVGAQILFYRDGLSAAGIGQESVNSVYQWVEYPNTIVPMGESQSYNMLIPHSSWKNFYTQASLNSSDVQGVLSLRSFEDMRVNATSGVQAATLTVWISFINPIFVGYMDSS